MSAFSAVVTTGIYCRPTCSARPNAENVRSFEFAAAAEAAGFRACLRCRPYREPQPVGWIGPELACRAVQLILDGALDEATEAELGRRLGISSRHLRRVFVDHVGATPDQLARSRRAHFARVLLDETDMPITDIAFAAGFGSVRQFNRASTEIFRAAPRELRSRRHKHDRLAADGGLALRLTFRPPLDWDTMLGYFAARAIRGVEQVIADTYRRTVVVDGDPGVLELSLGGPDHLLLRAHLPHWEGLIHVVQRARRIFDLDADLETANAHLDDPSIGALVAAHPGLRVPGAWDAFEVGVRAIIGQQVSVAGANTLTRRLVEQHGTPVPGLGPLGLTHTFPPPSTLAGAELGDVGLTGARADAIRAFARSVENGSVLLDRSVPLDDFVASISALPGLGPWTAQYLALRLGEPDAFPDGDLGLRRAIGGDRPVSASELAARAQPWRPWRAYAATQLWTSARPGISEAVLSSSVGVARV